MTFQRRPSRLQVALVLLALTAPPLAAQARISEATRMIATYPFSEPNPIPILTRDTRLYPYHSFDGYAAESVPQAWKVVTLENDLIEVFVLPEVGGKVWGAVVKKTGHEFIYRNEVLKFRNIALRGPWTSGGIEFNFGVIGHTPSTATPVDYALRENPDGSVSCIVGMMDLPSRTEWRVEIRLAADKASFDTNVLWHNPTTLEQPYYNWMTAAAFARADLTMTIPGNAFLGHPGDRFAWPTAADGRSLPAYAANDFGGNKSYHVVGEVADYFGGYYRDGDYGFGHWAPHGAMPGQKLWLWALSREGGIWTDLLTDSDGQYVEYQAGRLLVQYAPGSAITPIAQAGFEAGATDRWSETWFPLEGTGGLTAASRDGAIYSRIENGRLAVTVAAFGRLADTLTVWIDDRQVLDTPIDAEALVPVTHHVAIAPGATYRVVVAGLGIDHRSDPTARTLSRPWTTDPAALTDLGEADRLAGAARQLALGRRYPEARALFADALVASPWHRGALLGMAELEVRRGRYAEGLALAHRLLSLDAYDPPANFAAATSARALGRTADAIDGFGWAARSLRFRSAANVALAEIHLARGALTDATRHAEQALDHDRYNLPAREVLAIVARRAGRTTEATRLEDEMLAIDPLHHFVTAARYLTAPTAASRETFLDRLQGEYPEQTILELATDDVRRGGRDAATLLTLAEGPLALAWRGWLERDAGVLPAVAPVAFVFPYRPETIPVLRWATEQRPHWSWRYLLALNLWACDRPEEAADLMASLVAVDYAPALVARAHLLERVGGIVPEGDLRQAVRLDPGSRAMLVALVHYLQREGRWIDASVVSADGRSRFAGDFNLDLLHVASLVQLGRAAEAIAILETTRVLPSENSRASHQLYQQAHTIAALDALDRDQRAEARGHLARAREWPEHLGQGRPYQPEERLIDYLLGTVASAEGDLVAAQTAWQAVLDARPAAEPDLLGLMAASRLGRIPRPTAPAALPATLDDRLVRRALELTR